MSWKSKDREMGKYKVAVTKPKGNGNWTSYEYFHSLREARKIYNQRAEELRKLAAEQPQKLVAGLPTSYHVELVLCEESIDIGGEAPPEFDFSHLDAYGWNLLIKTQAADKAAVKMQEALEIAARKCRDHVATPRQAFEDDVEPVLREYSKFGANDTEPKFVARDLLVWYGKELSK